ncbi:MAG TPA: monovalent cation/H(+) antiporter subunit G [Chitinophagales bacterium]|nr:monovalent cation/H(+) antiporter subunit G [Chitinophagales bacterium]
MSDIIIMILSTLGSIFILIAAYGIVRMPDFYLRLSVTIKAATFGVGLILMAAALFFLEFQVTTKVFSIIFFIIITAPVGGHMIGRTAYIIGIKMWEGSVLDELKDKYDKKTHELKGEDESEDSNEKDFSDLK